MVMVASPIINSRRQQYRRRPLPTPLWPPDYAMPSSWVHATAAPFATTMHSRRHYRPRNIPCATKEEQAHHRYYTMAVTARALSDLAAATIPIEGAAAADMEVA